MSTNTNPGSVPQTGAAHSALNSLVTAIKTPGVNNIEKAYERAGASKDHTLGHGMVDRSNASAEVSAKAQQAPSGQAQEHAGNND